MISSSDSSAAMNNSNEFRCNKCAKLICKNTAGGHIEIKCLRCGSLNLLQHQDSQQLVITSPDGTILFINHAMEAICGFSNSEAVGKKPAQMWGKQMPLDFYKELWRVIKDEKKSYTASMTNKAKSGKLYNIDLTISPILDPDGNIAFYVGIEKCK